MGPDCKPEVGFPLLKLSICGLHIFTLILAHSLHTHTLLTLPLLFWAGEATDGTAYPGHSFIPVL